MKKFAFYYFVILTLAFSCSKPEECDERSWTDFPRLDQGFYMKGKMNGKSWEAASGFSGTGVDVNTIISELDTTYVLSGVVRNNCGDLINYVQFTSEVIPQLNVKYINPNFTFQSTYSPSYEPSFSSKYDSILVTKDFENYLQFTSFSKDTSIVEGVFQVQLTRKITEPNEPKVVRFSNVKFRMKNVF
ncbi:hypothetical protein [Haliscomenobacter sp.]|uniref:hypothetical protein n=1 Tax=Haliscomenobacter sp. TaxID=2717303 RepID=UPI003364BB43